ncbi:glycosyl hydrolase family 28-related protein [Mesorhizobium sp. M0684]|uniref:glycosyl hydrolase family 28-related protein n=1 Tax=Mesorhizobium sp. M0684 TaxID=2956986 RepID=UPI00333D6346
MISRRQFLVAGPTTIGVSGALDPTKAGAASEIPSRNEGVPYYPTAAGMRQVVVPQEYSSLRVDGYLSPGDGGGALYKKASTEPAHHGKFQTANGIWWELAGDNINVKMFGAQGDGISDDSLAIQSAINFTDTVVEKSSESLTGSDGDFRAPVEIFFPRGVYVAKRLQVFDNHVSLRGDGAVLRLADPFSYLLVYRPWAGGWQGTYSISGLTFDGDVFSHLLKRYGRSSLTREHLTDIAERADLKILVRLENIGLIIGSNNVDIRGCSFTRCGLGLWYYTGNANIFGRFGDCFAYSGLTENCGFRRNLYGFLAYSPTGYVGNITLADCYHSGALKASIVLAGKSVQNIRISGQTADTRGIPFVFINSDNVEEHYNRMEPNTTTIREAVDMSDLLGSEKTVPYSIGGERISHYIRNSSVSVRKPYAGNLVYAVQDSRVALDGYRQSATGGFVCDDSSFITDGAGFGVLLGKTLSFYRDPTGTFRSQPISSPPARRVSGKSSFSSERKTLLSVPTTGRRNYFNDDPFLSYDLPRMAGNGLSFSLVDDGVFFPKCLEVAGHAEGAWSFANIPPASALKDSEPEGFLLTALCVKRISEKPFMLNGPHGLTRMVMDERDVWRQFMSIQPIGDGISSNSQFTVEDGILSTYRLANLAIMIVSSWMTAKALFEGNSFPILTFDLINRSERIRLPENSQRGAIGWENSSTSKYMAASSLVGSEDTCQIATPNEYIRALFVRASGTDKQDVKVGSGGTDDFYASRVALPDGGWVKIGSDMLMDTAGTAEQNGSIRITPLGPATMDIEYKVEFGKLI